MNAPAQRMAAHALRAAGRNVATPFAIFLAEGGEVSVHKLLRVLPGKRVVGEGVWQGERVLIKLFIAAGSARHAAQEQAGIEALREARVPTPELLFAGPLAEGGHVLLTRFLENAQTLAESWGRLGDGAANTAAALEILRPAFATLGALHARGLVHEDLHLGNFLSYANQIFIIDGDAVRVLSPGESLAPEPATKNLALLFAQLPRGCEVSHEALLAAYRSGGGEIDAPLLEREVTRLREWRLKDFLAKTLRECTLFAARRTALRFTVVRREEEDRLRVLLADPDRAIAGGSLLKDGNTSTVARVNDAGGSLVIKRYNLKNLSHVFSRFWRPTRAWHSWREGHRLAFLGIATPAPLALLEERCGPLRRRGFLVNAHCPGANLLAVLDPDREPEAVVARAIVGLFAALNEACISHGDLKATNLLWHEGRVFLIDLDAMVQHGSQEAHARAWRRDRSRFLRNWPEASTLHRWLDENLPPDA